MKKAYVKPVFVAEEFEGTVSVASCQYGVDAQTKIGVYDGLHICPNIHCAHDIGGNNGKGTDGDVQNWWNYATETTTGKNENGLNGPDNAYLFTSGQIECDFVWNSQDSKVGIWTQFQDQWNTAISEHNNRIQKENWNPVISWISSFKQFFGIPGGENDNHRPGIEGQGEFFS